MVECSAFWKERVLRGTFVLRGMSLALCNGVALEIIKYVSCGVDKNSLGLLFT